MKHIKKNTPSILFICLLLSLFVSQTIWVKAAETKATRTIYTDQSITLPTPKGILKSQVKWTTSNKKIVTITQSGKITGKKAGTATIKAVKKGSSKILVSCKIRVKKFQQQKISSKITVTKDGILNVMELLDKKYYVISTKAELKQLKENICTQYVKKGYGTEEQCKKTSFYKKLSKYNKSFFEKKSLCLMSHTLPNIGQPTSLGAFTRKQTANGKVYAELEVVYEKLPEDAVLVSMIGYQNYILELKKSDTETLQNYKISVTKY